jgi:hypothetical protein
VIQLQSVEDAGMFALTHEDPDRSKEIEDDLVDEDDLHDGDEDWDDCDEDSTEHEQGTQSARPDTRPTRRLRQVRT